MVSSQTVAALYIDPRGPYPHIAHKEASGEFRFVDCWDAERDARLYAGPHPVVAHPPCKHWGRLRHLAKDTKCDDCHGTGQHPYERKLYDCASCNGRGWLTDKDCAPRAVEQVRAFGGVLEHPAGSLLWEACGLPEPDFEIQKGARLFGRARFISTARNERGDFTDEWGGYTIEVDQCEWGHVARKRTWLYLVGVPREALEAPPFPGREPTRSVSGKRGRATQAKHPTWTEQLPRASDTQRRRTPPLFAEYLVRLARSVQK